MTEPKASYATIAAPRPPSQWFMELDFIPPTVNHSYLTTPAGRRLLTREAKRVRGAISLSAAVAGFRPKKGKRYAIRVRFTFPNARSDLDGPVKHLLDGIFGTALDHQVDHLEVEKVVEKGVSRTEVWWKELT